MMKAVVSELQLGNEHDETRRARFLAKPWSFRLSIYILLAGLGAAAGLGVALVIYAVVQMMG